MIAVRVNDLLGVPFELGGRDPHVALDCLGLVSWVLELHGHPPFDPAGELSRACEDGPVAGDQVVPADWTAVPAGAEQRLDVVLILDKGAATHVGIVGEDGYVLHTTRGASSHLTALRRLRRDGRVHSVWRPSC